MSEEGKSDRLRWRHLWKKAILETLLLIRMEKENNSLKGKLILLDLFKRLDIC